ncbi:hypothetical protein V5739_09620 [Salinimicrobium sp. TIG7-5_MAKvit]|uniref:hypothetical protein n=1 Tax=Salinimicrobium sp. TIG7-5_MAKvit TaxID=3121289 RepID=UPI003C6E628E
MIKFKILFIIIIILSTKAEAQTSALAMADGLFSKLQRSTTQIEAGSRRII